MSSKFGIIVQARLHSKRLPNKVITPIYKDYSILDIVASRVKQLTINAPRIIATGDYARNYALKQWAQKNDLDIFFGEENDVLKRFIDCSLQYGLSRVMRICCDNPFLDIVLVNAMAGNDNNNADYLGYLVNNQPAILSHYGFFAEIISVSSLVRAWDATSDETNREHVTRYIYNHPGQFSVNLIQCPEDLQKVKNVRLTVDTAVDFATAAKILDKLMEKRKNFDYHYKDVLEIVKGNSQLQQAMRLQIEENSK